MTTGLKSDRRLLVMSLVKLILSAKEEGKIVEIIKYVSYTAFCITINIATKA